MKAKIGVLLLLLTAVSLKAQSNLSTECGISIPKLFEPNAETGIIMEIETADVQHFEMKIYNNWGIQVFESKMTVKSGMQAVDRKRIKVKSDGSDDIKLNLDLKNGTYYYTLDTFCTDGSRKVKEGNLQLIRTEKH
jgi:hypothetical protein